MWGEGNFTANVLIFCKKRVDKLFKLIFHDKYFNANSIFLTLTIVYSFKKFVGFISISTVNFLCSIIFIMCAGLLSVVPTMYFAINN